MRHVFIINPNAGKGKAIGSIHPVIQKYCTEHRLDWDVYIPDSPTGAREFIRAEAEKAGDNPIRFYACGGDGTLYEAVNAAYPFKNAEVGVIPLGSGNDFIRLFGTAEQFRDIDAQVNGTAVALDLVKCDKGQVAINQSSMGFDGEVCAKKEEFKNLLPVMRGNTAYTASVAYCFFHKMKNEFTIQIDDGEPVKKNVIFCVAASSRWYGGGFKAAPFALPNDGYLDFVIVEKNMPRVKLLPLINMYKNGEHAKLADRGILTYIRGKKIKIHSDKQAAINCDGEYMYVNDVTFEVMEKGIKFIVPKTSSYFHDVEMGKINGEIPVEIQKYCSKL